MNRMTNGYIFSWISLLFYFMYSFNYVSEKSVYKHLYITDQKPLSVNNITSKYNVETPGQGTCPYVPSPYVPSLCPKIKNLIQGHNKADYFHKEDDLTCQN